MKSKKWLALFFAIVLIGMACLAGFVALIDALFHYHAPLPFLEYPMGDERYQNDGIQRQWDYELMITGTSEAQNFNATTASRLWQKSAIKTCYSGASLHELGKSIRTAIGHNPKISMVICSLDANNLERGAKEDGFELHEDRKKTPNFDEYGRFDTYRPSGKEALLKTYREYDYSDLY
ncbi:MAG: hypothetical protein K6F31_06285 [Acetatifactor sp.]|nr:hypothetical protein [Acetatifactor sp.]